MIRARPEEDPPVSLITLTRLGVSLGAPLFANLDLAIHPGDRIGLVAANGRGKSTLLRCLAGLLDPTEGGCRRARGLRVTLMLQEPEAAHLPMPLRDVVLAALPAESRDWDAWRADVTLDALGIPGTLRDRPLGALSGGWRRMALLARAAVTEPDLLLLDEPTNHLDLERIGLLQRWISALPRETAMLVASHDRAFLDTVTRRTLFLRQDTPVEFALPFSAARASLEEVDLATARRHATDLREAAQLRRQAAKLHNIGVNSGADLLKVKTRQLKDRAGRIEAAARPAQRESPVGRLVLSESGTEAKVLLRFDALAVTAPDGRRLFGTGRLWLQPGDRVVLLGRNGSGKSRLLGIVADALRGGGCAGLACSPTIVPGVCDQSLSHLRPEATPHQVLSERFEIGDQRIRTLLAGAGFPVERQSRRVGALSGGQRARLAMLVLRLEQPNLYLLDEPTNHLDIAGQEALERELQRGDAACLLASHDRRFVETVGNRFWQIEQGCLVEKEGPEAFFEAAMGG